MSKITFAVGSISGVSEGIKLASENGLLDTVAGVVFTMVFLIVIGLLFGMAALQFLEWGKEFIEWINKRKWIGSK